MKNVIKKSLSILIVFTMVFGLLACGNKNSGSKTVNKDGVTLTKVRLAVMTNNQSHWYGLIGKDTGIFEKHGIQIELTEFAAGINTVDAVVTQQADIGILADYAAINRIGNTQANSNIRFITKIATNEGKSATKLYVNPKKVSSLKDLAGVNFVTLPGTIWDYWTTKSYEKAGIAKTERKTVNVDSVASAVTVLVNGNGDAFWTSGANADKLISAGFKPIATTDDMGLYTEQYFVTTSEYISANSEILKNFIAALDEIATYINENPKEAAKIYEKETGYASSQFLSDLQSYNLGVNFTQNTLNHLNDIKKWAVDNGSFSDYTLDEYIDLRALKEAVPTAETYK